MLIYKDPLQCLSKVCTSDNTTDYHVSTMQIPVHVHVFMEWRQNSIFFQSVYRKSVFLIVIAQWQIHAGFLKGASSLLFLEQA